MSRSNAVSQNLPLVSVNLAVLNGEKYLPYCLTAIARQTYPNLEVNVWDNASSDRTPDILKSWSFPRLNLFFSKQNWGMWPAQEELLKQAKGRYVLVLSVDVLLDPLFVEKAVAFIETDCQLGALQAKIFQYHFDPSVAPKNKIKYTNLIDTIGFKMERSRRVINLGQGEKDCGQYDQPQEIFGVEGAAPFFRRSALEDCQINSELIDKEMFWYGDDLDLAWRMRLFGWKQFYHPALIAFHDRSTTKGLSHRWQDYWSRIKIRRQIPLQKRGWDWRNKRLARLKNDYLVHVWQDWPHILLREIMELGYSCLFEPAILREIPQLVKLIPKFLKKRRAVMAKAKLTSAAMRPWIK